MEVLRAEYSEGLVKFYSDKLESEIFALYYYCLDTYKSNAEKCAENLRFILNNQETLDCVMTTSIDFNMLAKKISDMNDGESEAMDGERYAIYRGRDDFADIMSEPVERNPPSDGSDGIEGYRRLPQKMDLEEEFELPDQIEEKTMSFEFLEELTKVREDEIKKLKGILLNIQQENQLLKDALVEVKGHLIALESTELELDLKVER